jgi:hypothetical protein
MLQGESLAGAKRSQSISRSQRFPSAMLGFGVACALILVCAAASPELRAQVSCTRSPTADAAGVQPVEISASDSCAGAHLRHTLDCSKRTPPDNNEDGTKAALACEWVSTDRDGAERAFYALRLLTCSTQDSDVRKSDTCLALNRTPQQDSRVALDVLDALADGTTVTTDRYLYRWALGDPDNKGKAKGTPLANFPDMLAKVNTLTAGSKKRPKDEEDLYEGELFECTKSLIGKIYQDEGQIVLARIHDTFVKNKLNLALTQLLQAEIQLLDAEKKRRNDIPLTDYSQNIEKFRAAFEIDDKRLAKQVADKINSTQQ